MGSVGEHLKGETPFLQLIKNHNAWHAEAIRRCAKAVPLWMKIAAVFGWKTPSYQWQARNQYRFWE